LVAAEGLVKQDPDAPQNSSAAGRPRTNPAELPAITRDTHQAIIKRHGMQALCN
jgi:hypothetical protein